MRKTQTWSLGLLGLAIAAGSCLGQVVDATKFYKLEFVVKEVEGAKVVNSRSYFMTVPVDLPGQGGSGGASIRTSNRVPLGTPGSSQFSYTDVGVNLDCKTLRETQLGVSVYLTADITTNSIEPAFPAPVMRSNRWSSTVVVPVKKPTVVYASDDATSKRQMQLELTAIPIL